MKNKKETEMKKLIKEYLEFNKIFQKEVDNFIKKDYDVEYYEESVIELFKIFKNENEK